MSLEDITIYRDLQIIDGFVQVPPNRERDKTRYKAYAALDRVPGASIGRLARGGFASARRGQQKWLRLPGISPTQWYASDPIAAIRDTEDDVIILNRSEDIQSGTNGDDV